MTSAAAHSTAHGSPLREELSYENINLTQGGGIGKPLIVAGVIATVVGLAGAGIAGGGLSHAIAAYHVATLSILAVCLGATFFCLVWNLLNTGWTGTIRRQAENIMAFLPKAFLLIVPTLVIEAFSGGVIFQWMNPVHYGDHLLVTKASFFFGPRPIVDPDTHEPVKHFVFPLFFFARAAFYGFFWTFLSRRLVNLSLEQDKTGDRWLTSKARYTSAWGMLVFALTTAFAAFDWVMSVDFRFFSTMWGVWFFASAAYSFLAVLIFVLIRLLAAGKLKQCVTVEHFHELG
jgi:hypothetical protein